MTGGGAEAEPEEELSSRSSGWDSENWERSEEGRTKSKNKVLPDGFLDPLPRQKSSKLQRFSNMADRSRHACSSRHTAQHTSTTVNVQPVQHSIASLGASHRAHDADQGCTSYYHYEEDDEAIVAPETKDDTMSSCTGPNIASSNRCLIDSVQLDQQEAVVQQVPSPQFLPNAKMMTTTNFL